MRYVPQAFARVQRGGGRQIVVSTHSSDLLHDSGIGLDEVLLLTPGIEGTQVGLAASIREVATLLDSGQSLAETVLPRTRPSDVEQLAQFAG